MRRSSLMQNAIHTAYSSSRVHSQHQFVAINSRQFSAIRRPHTFTSCSYSQQHHFSTRDSSSTHHHHMINQSINTNQNAICWSSHMRMYHTNMMMNESNQQQQQQDKSATATSTTKQQTQSTEELLDKMIKRSKTAERLLKPQTVQDRVQSAKLKSIEIVKQLPKWTLNFSIILAKGLWNFIKNPMIVTTWYAVAKSKIVHEFRHYYSGSKLLVADVRSASRLVLRVLQGHTLTRRERNHLVRTTSDIFRLVPFAFFVIVPFAELLLPVFIKLFPNMLPSQFEDKLKKEEQLRREFKAKLEMGKFLQDTVELMAMELKKSDQAETVATAEELQKFIDSLRKGESVNNEDIIRFAKLFSDEITLDNVSRAQLMAVCRMVGLSPYGSDAILRFKLRNKIRQLKADDRLIFWEGVKSLSREELMYACQARGMKIVLSQEKMQQQLKEWIDLSLNKSIPSSLLLLSRAFTYTNEVESSDAIKMALGSLSDDVLGEVALQSSAPTDNVYEKKLESLKRQDKLIQEEEETRKRREEELKKAQQLEESKPLEPIAAADKIAETAEAEKNEKMKKIQTLNELVATLASESSLRNEREELDSLINDHIELIGQTTSGVKEEAIHRLNKLNSKLGEIIGRLEENIEQVDSAIGENFNIIDKDKDGVITVAELRESLNLLKDKPSEAMIEHLIKVLDRDGDGRITVKDLLLEMKVAKKNE